MSLSFFNESFYDGTGSINEEVERLSDAGILLVTSAGNYAEEHWSGVFDDPDLDGLHDFEVSARGLPIYWKSGTRRLYLSWDQFGYCGQTDLDAYVYNSSGNLVGRSTSTQDFERQNCQPVERVSVQAAEEGWYYLRVQHVSGVPSVRMRVLARGEIWEGNAEGSITDPGTHPLALTVGAVRATDYLFNDAEYFSSRGPHIVRTRQAGHFWAQRSQYVFLRSRQFLRHLRIHSGSRWRTGLRNERASGNERSNGRQSSHGSGQRFFSDLGRQRLRTGSG